MLNIAQKIARSAGDIIMRAIDRLEHIEIFEKAENDFVTEVDKQAEKEIIFHLKRAYPDYSILGEESGLLEGKDPDSRWIIDPLDGTSNYIHGIPHFCVSLGFVYKGRIEVGVIYDPVRDEMFTAARGKGAQLNNRRMRVTQTRQLERALLTTELPARNLTENVSALITKAGSFRVSGSSALDLAYVAAGRTDAYWEAIQLYPWDLAAGALLVKEAGGFVTDLAGKDNFLEEGTIIAATPKIYPYIFKALMERTRNNSGK